MINFDYKQMKKDKILELTARINDLQQSMNTTIQVIQAEQFRLREMLEKVKRHKQPLQLNFIDASNTKKNNNKPTKR